MQFPCRAIARPSSYLFRPHPLNLCASRSFLRTLITQIDDSYKFGNMGKEKPSFQLKTPKGTKDCEFKLLRNATGQRSHQVQGRERTWSSAIEYSPQ